MARTNTQTLGIVWKKNIGQHGRLEGEDAKSHLNIIQFITGECS
jgi:hypothetical protein